VIPAIEHAMGAPEKHSTHSVLLVDSIKTRDDITVFLPVQLEANNTARSNPAQNSGDLVRILHSDGYIALPPTIKGTYPAEQCFEFFQWL